MKLDQRWQIPAICIFLALITSFVFGQTLRYPFINFDDPQYVLKNQQVIRGLTNEGILWAFTHTYAANWHPLTWISHMLDCQFYGLNPRGHHLTNVLLHAANAILLFLVLRQMTGALWRSAFVAAIFAIHPLRVESVAWISERKDVLSGFFFLLTLAAYLRYAHLPSRRRYLLVLLVFVCGLMSKPMLVTTPLVLLLLDYWPLKRVPNEWWRGIRLKLIGEKVPLLILALLTSFLTVFAQRPAIEAVASYSLPVRIANAIEAYVVYLREMFWPTDLALLYSLEPDHIKLGLVLLSLGILIFISLLVLRTTGRRYLVVGWLWYLIMLLPVIGIIKVGNQAHADRYTYLPQIGIYFLLTWAVTDLAGRWHYYRYVLTGVGVVSIAMLAAVARMQASYWQSSEIIWRITVARTNNNPSAHVSLGEALYEQGKLDEAIAEYEEVLRINPIHVQANSALGAALLEAGLPAQSISHLQAALRVAPNFAEAHYNLGNTYLATGQGREAIEHYNKAIEFDPEDIEAQNNLAWLLATFPQTEVRDGARAVTLAERADSLTGGQNQVIAATLAAAYAENGQFDRAITTAERARNLALTEGNQARAESIREQLEQYRAGAPFRDRRYETTTR